MIITVIMTSNLPVNKNYTQAASDKRRESALARIRGFNLTYLIGRICYTSVYICCYIGAAIGRPCLPVEVEKGNVKLAALQVQFTAGAARP